MKLFICYSISNKTIFALMTHTPILSIKNLTKYYGNLKALDDLSLDVYGGEILGFLGPNGSGKTTTLGILLGILEASSGSFSWFGEPPTPQQRKKIGALLETPLFYPYLSGYDNLKIIARIKDAPLSEIDEVFKVVGLEDRKNSKFKTYSLGMKQRLAIGAALLGNPDVMILDEPTNGLDPTGIVEIRDLIVSIAKRGMTIVLASHLLDEVEKICTHVVVLEQGKKLHAGRVSEVLKSSETIELAAYDMERLKTAITEEDFIADSHSENGMLVVELSRHVDPAEINRLLANKGVYVSHLSARKKSLENYFLELLSEQNV
jgi:ABC-2 type transport system ATP-binding protein